MIDYSFVCPRCGKDLKILFKYKPNDWFECTDECGISVRYLMYQTNGGYTVSQKDIFLDTSTFEVRWRITNDGEKQCYLYSDVDDEDSEIKINWLPYDVTKAKINKLLNLV